MNNNSISIGGNNSAPINQDVEGPVVIGEGHIVSTGESRRLNEIIEALLDKAKLFPEEQRKSAEVNLKDLKKEVEKPANEQDQEKVNLYLKRLATAAASVLLALEFATGQIANITSNSKDAVVDARAIATEVQRFEDTKPAVFKALSPRTKELTQTVKVFAEDLGNIAETYQQLSAEQAGK